MRNTGLDEAQAGIKIARRNINNLRYADNTILLAENEEELKSLLMKVNKQSGKSWLKTQHSENEDHPWTVACQAPLSREFSRQEYWSGQPFSSIRHLPDPEIKPGFPALQAESLPSEPPGKPTMRIVKGLNKAVHLKCLAQ